MAVSMWVRCNSVVLCMFQGVKQIGDPVFSNPIKLADKDIVVDLRGLDFADRPSLLQSEVGSRSNSSHYRGT